MRGKVVSTGLIFVLSMAVAILVLGVPGQAAKGQKTLAISSATATVTLTDAEVYYLTHMREEEKLARDVYTTLNDTYGVTVFSQIIPSEQRHFDAVGTLIARYGVTDPAADATVGVFTVDEFIELYPSLVNQGYLSLGEAMCVGVEIEEIDIADLTAAMAVTTRPDILSVYNNLLSASLNHLASFQSHLEVMGYTCQ